MFQLLSDIYTIIKAYIESIFDKNRVSDITHPVAMHEDESEWSHRTNLKFNSLTKLAIFRNKDTRQIHFKYANSFVVYIYFICSEVKEVLPYCMYTRARSHR